MMDVAAAVSELQKDYQQQKLLNNKPEKVSELETWHYQIITFHRRIWGEE